MLIPDSTSGIWDQHGNFQPMLVPAVIGQGTAKMWNCGSLLWHPIFHHKPYIPVVMPVICILCSAKLCSQGCAVRAVGHSHNLALTFILVSDRVQPLAVTKNQIK